MNLIPWRRKQEEHQTTEPTAPLARLRNEMDMLFDRFFPDPWEPGESTLLSGFGAFPRTDLAESENDVTVTMELPGVSPNEIQLDLSDGVLTVHGEKKQEKEEKQKNYHCVERHYGSFHRSVPLPSSIDPDKVDAKFKDGVLTIIISKNPAARPKRITINQT